ncbi:unnamed protein product, partial [Heterobilharzia americana]
ELKCTSVYRSIERLGKTALLVPCCFTQHDINYKEEMIPFKPIRGCLYIQSHI